MSTSPLAGKPPPADLLIDPAKLEKAYHDTVPDVSDPGKRVAFGTSGHRGSPLAGTFNEAHVLAVAQAVCDYRRAHGIDGPVYVGKDTHAASAPAEQTALEVLAANGVTALAQTGGNGFTPTPAVSHAILAHNRGRTAGLADGVILTPSHNPPGDGGFKYNPPTGGPADTSVTAWIEKRANELLQAGNRDVKRAKAAPTAFDYVRPYVADLRNAIDMDAIRSAGITLGADPLGGAAVGYWEPIAAEYGVNITVVNPKVDPTFSFIPVDHDGQVRMDCSSPYAMVGLVKLRERFRVAFGNDPDADRHGIVVPSVGLLTPNQFLAAAVDYLLAHRPDWPSAAAVGKTAVTTALIDRVAAARGRRVCEVPVGFKWFAPGLFDGSLLFGGEESAGASFLRRDGSVWTTDKDGPLLALLAAEMTAVTGRDPGELYKELAAKFGESVSAREDAPATPEQQAKLRKLTPSAVPPGDLAGEPITAALTTAPGNGEPLGGLKVTTAGGWFAARPSGTEPVYKVYAESFRGPDHLTRLLAEARRVVAAALG